MRSFYFIIAFFISDSILGQTIISSDDYLVKTRQERYEWQINGVTFKPSKDKTRIYPNYFGNDTIIFIDKGQYNTPDTIITRIPVNKEYIMTISCGDSYFDMYDVNKNPWKYIHDTLSLLRVDSLIWASKEYGQVKFRIKNKPPNDTLICVYWDLAGIPYGQMITKAKNYDWLSPSIGFWSGNNHYIIIANKKQDFEYELRDHDIISWDGSDFYSYPGIFKIIQIRLFNNEQVVIEYDCLTNETKVVFQD